MSDPNRNALWARAIIEELVHGGVRDVCVSPGSRSTPLTLAAASHDALRVHNHIDERGAAFFALGVAKITGEPVALICTSGSAGSHYHPAFIEALYARLPLIALTADRPVELVGTGAGQTIAQQNMFGPHALASAHLELPRLTGQSLRRMRAMVDRLAATSRGVHHSAPGPVHINVPFAEPLAPTWVEGDIPADLAAREPLGVHGRRGAPLLDLSSPRPAPHPDTIASLVDRIASIERGVIVCGPHELAHGEMREGILALAAATRFPLFADPVSSVRFPSPENHTVSRHDAIFRSREWARHHAPDLVLRFGAQPTSKVYRFWREDHPEAEEILIDPFGGVFDQSQQAARVICADPNALASAVASRISPPEAPTEWASAFDEAASLAADVMTASLQLEERDAPLWEGFIAHEVTRAIPAHGTLWCASSMPIRDVDAFSAPRRDVLDVYANRGANGIDGLIAGALGAASASGKPGVLLIGDVAFLHDSSSLAIAARGLDPRAHSPHLTIVLVNNGGGGIFEHLPIASHREHFERHFLTPHQTDFGLLCRAHGVSYKRATTRAAFCDALAQSIDEGGVRVIEAVVELELNLAKHRSAWRQVADKLDELVTEPREES